MATIILETGQGLTDSNSYCSTDEADIYYVNHLYSTNWLNCTDPEAALIWATRILDEQVNWVGQKYSDTQALRWPRQFVYDRDGKLLDGLTIHQFIKNAVADLAGYLAAADRFAEAQTTGFKKIQVDTIELEVDKLSKKRIIPASTWSIIGPFGSSYRRRKRLVLG